MRNHMITSALCLGFLFGCGGGGLWGDASNISFEKTAPVESQKVMQPVDEMKTDAFKDRHMDTELNKAKAHDLKLELKQSQDNIQSEQNVPMSDYD